MYRYLLDHAITNVWCNGDQDNQLIIAGQRISRPLGELNTFKMMQRTLNLPKKGKYYQVFQIGQVRPHILGLLTRNPEWTIEQWISFSDSINNLKLFVNLYTAKGVELPRFKSHYMFTNDRNLIIAVEQDANFPVNFATEAIYLRVYSNAFYQTLAADAVSDFLYCEGKDIVTEADIIAIQQTYLTYAALPGHVFCYKNGFIVDSLNLVTVAVGDTVEFVYDSSIKRVVTFTVADLSTFTSILDSKIKYLLHHQDIANDTIEYHDDIDVHVYVPLANNRYKGFYYHRNSVDSHRMVTHRDYSISADYLLYIADYLNSVVSETPLDTNTFKVQVKIRHSGYQRPLIYDNSRIFELYKLPHDKILQAMTGVNSTVPEWRAENLENAGYPEIMKAAYPSITMDMIQRGYGYNGISKIVGDTPIKTTLYSGRQRALLPYGLMDNSTVYEYDANGVMLGYHHHVTGLYYEAVDNNTRLIEVISGQGTFTPDVRFGTDNIDLPVYDNYRVYMCYLILGDPNDEWIDITGGPQYSVVANKLVSNQLEPDQFFMVRTDATFLAYDLNFASVGGNIYFTLSEMENRDATIPENTILPVPLGELDIFLNGKSLIRNLDYIIHFPLVVINNKKYLNQPAGSSIQNIHIRFSGFSSATLELDPIEDYGFIQHGVLSDDSQFDIRDDKVMRITVDGSLVHREDLIFSELHSGVSIVNPINGKPYQIKDIVVPLKQLTDANTYSLRNLSIAVDTRVSDYLTINLPQPSRDAPSAIPERYPVISPFISRIINNLLNDVIDNTLLQTALTDNDILTICQPFESLLEFDPISVTNRPNPYFVIIHPHHLNNTIDLTIYQYRFLKRVVGLYCDGLIELSPFLTYSV